MKTIAVEPSTRPDARAFAPAPRDNEPAVVVIFGASGDLTRRKLVPALYNLSAASLLNDRSQIIGVARRDKSDDSFRSEMESGVREFAHAGFDDQIWHKLRGRIRYVQGSFDDPEAYRRLAASLKDLQAQDPSLRSRLYYLATPPSAVGTIVDSLKSAGLADEGGEAGFARIIVEKPFGSDLASAQKLNSEIACAFREEQIFRIDHYLGKETVQNVLVFRLGNGIFEPLWNRRYVDHVEITAAETLGVEGRAGYFDTAGSARDMLQSHLLQLLTVVAMEPPIAFEARTVHDEKVKVLRALRLGDAESLRASSVRAQYVSGMVGSEQVRGYRDEPGVAPGSQTETYVALRLQIDNWRWAGVPFYLRTGKRLSKRTTEVAIVFKQPPLALFQQTGVPELDANVLSIRIQPDEGISLKFASKVPGHDLNIDPVQMDFLYSRAFGIEPPEAYERLLLDALEGDSTLFARIDEVELGWRLTDALRAAWNGSARSSLCYYDAGSGGPKEADSLLEREGRAWRAL